MRQPSLLLTAGDNDLFEWNGLVVVAIQTRDALRRRFRFADQFAFRHQTLHLGCVVAVTHQQADYVSGQSQGPDGILMRCAQQADSVYFQ